MADEPGTLSGVGWMVQRMDVLKGYGPSWFRGFPSPDPSGQLCLRACKGSEGPATENQRNMMAPIFIRLHLNTLYLPE